MPSNANVPIEVPFTIVIDGREKTPYTFQGLHADANKNGRPLNVRWEWGFLATGDYSILGYENQVCVERKSLEDLFSTLGNGRSRFEREHVRMSEMSYASVIVEGGWRDVLKSPPSRSRLCPKSVFRTAISWGIKYKIHWFMAEDRRLGEISTFRILNRWHQSITGAK